MLPPHVDPRQMSIFSAGWTAISLKYQALAGAASLTYFETHGPAGIMAGADGGPPPDLFPLLEGVYPVYRVFESLAGLDNPRVRHTLASQPRLVDALCVVHDAGRLLWLVNASGTPQTVRLVGLTGTFRVRTLDPAAWPAWGTGADVVAEGDEEAVTVMLPAHGVWCLRSV